MSKKPKILSVEVTTLIRVAPDQERERLSLHFKGKSLVRLLAMVDNVESGNFYEAAKTYFKECSREEREAVGIGMSEIIEGVGEREVNKLLWAERKPSQLYVECNTGIIDGSALEYPRYTLIANSTPSKEATIKDVLGDSPSP